MKTGYNSLLHWTKVCGQQCFRLALITASGAFSCEVSLLNECFTISRLHRNYWHADNEKRSGLTCSLTEAYQQRLPVPKQTRYSAFTTRSLHLWPLLNPGFPPQIYFVFLAALSSRACSIKSHKRMPLPHSPKLLLTLTSKQLQNKFLVFLFFFFLSSGYSVHKSLLFSIVVTKNCLSKQ